jgi:hypothetical protein
MLLLKLMAQDAYYQRELLMQPVAQWVSSDTMKRLQEEHLQ